MSETLSWVMPKISETLMQMKKSNSCIYPTRSFMPLQYCCLNSPTRPAREGCCPPSQATHRYTQPCTRRLWLQDGVGVWGGLLYPLCPLKMFLDSVKRGVICLSLSSMIPPAIMEQPYHNQTDHSQHRHADQWVTEADYQDDPLFCWGRSWWKTTQKGRQQSLTQQLWGR